MTNRRALFLVAGAAVALSLAVFEWTKQAAPASAALGREDVEPPQREEAPLDLADATGVRAAGSVSREVEEPAEPGRIPTATGMIRLVGEIRDRQHQRIRSSYRQPTTSITIESDTFSLQRGAPEGTFAFEDIAPGRIQLTCADRGFRTERRTITLVAGETEHREDFELDHVWDLGVRVVLSDGRVLGRGESRSVLKNDLDLRVSKDPPPERWSCSWTEAWRAQRLVDRSMGDASKGTFAELRIQLEPPIHLSASLAGYVVASARIESQMETITLEIPVERFLALGSSFACRVVDRETWAPIPGALARMLPVLSGTDLSAIAADEAGEIRGDDLPANEYILDVHDPTRSTPRQTVELLPGRLTDLGTVALDPNVTLDVRFVDPTGRPVEVDAVLSPTSHGHLERTVSGGQFHVRSGLDGRCHFEKLARTEYRLSRLRDVSVKDDRRPASVSVHSEARPARNAIREDGEFDVRPRIVDLRRGEIPELVVAFESMQWVSIRASSEAARSSAYWIQASDGALCTLGLLDDRLQHGAFLAPGVYRLLVGPDLEHAREIPFTVGDAPMTIPIEP